MEFDPQRLKRINPAMQRFVDNGKVAGITTLLLKQGKVVHQGCYGVASPDRPMQADTIFRIWSITKVITTVAALTLYEQGYFTLNQDITEFLPEFKHTPVYVSGEGNTMEVEPRKTPITIRQLMTHTSGLASGIRLSHPITGMMADCTQKHLQRGSLKQMVQAMAEIPLIYQPFTRWHYSHGLELIARLIEVISGQRFHIFLQEQIFKPLGMIDSGYVVKDDQFERFSGLYKWDDQQTLQLAEAPAESPEYRDRDRESDSSWWSPGGFGLVSTPMDCARFAQMLHNGGELDGARILAPSTVELMTANHLPAHLLPYGFMGSPLKYGYGHGLGVHVLMDRGEAALPCNNGEYWKDGGAGTIFWVDPSLNLVGIAMYQLLDFWRVPIFDTFRALVYQAGI